MDISDIRRDLLESLGTTGNMDNIMAIQSTSTIQRLISLVLGILSMAICILIPITVLAEVSYIQFPLVRTGVNNLIDKSGGFIKRALELTLKDGVKAVETAETSGGEKSAMGQYAILKVKSILIAMFFLAFVLIGTDRVVDWVWNLFSGLGDVISDILHF